LNLLPGAGSSSHDNQSCPNIRALISVFLRVDIATNSEKFGSTTESKKIDKVAWRDAKFFLKRYTAGVP